MKALYRLTRSSLVMMFLSCSSLAFCQGPQARLTGSAGEGPRVRLAGSRLPDAQLGQDAGRVPPEMIVHGIMLAFKRSAAQEADLQQLLTSQQSPASPLYRKWLTPESFAGRFGVAEADIALTKSWLQSQGFQVEGVARSRDRITFSGSAAQVQAAFGTELHYYQANGERHFAPSTDLSLPAQLASVTSAILHLSDFRPRPTAVLQSQLQPQFTSLATQAHYLTPNDLITMYDMMPLIEQSAQGGGQIVAVVGQSYVDVGNPSAISNFQGFLTGYTPISPVLVPGSGVEAISPGDQAESELDLEYASGTARNANIFLVFVGDSKNYSVFDALSYAIEQNIASVVSISYGTCEALVSASYLDQNNALFEQASAQGQTLVAASGDSGSTACAPFSATSGLTTSQRQSLAVSFPADSPNVTAVGGTQMAAGTFAEGPSQYWATAAGSDATGSLLSYVPEVAWNEGSASHGILAGGGGVSTYFSRPAWQANVPGLSSGAFRLMPDVSLQASVQSPGFIICTSDASFAGSAASGCAGGLGANGNYVIAGGTSFAAPIFAGLIAILNQAEHTTGLGNINPVLYQLAGSSSSYASVFHDTTSGSIACVSGASLCTAAGQSGYAAIPGYDQATGLGSVDFANFVSAWPQGESASLQSTDTLLIAPQSSAAPGDSIPVQIVVQTFYQDSGSTKPTGSVSVAVDGVVVQSSVAIVPDATHNYLVADYTFVAPTAAGSHLLTVVYPGDATHAASSGTLSFLVGTVTATGSFGLAAGNLTVAKDSSGSTQVTVTPSGGFSGRIVWSLSAMSSSTTSISGCYAIKSPVVDGTTSVKLTIGVGSACNAALPQGRDGLQMLSFASPTMVESQRTPTGVLHMVLPGGILIFLTLGSWQRRKRLPVLMLFPILAFISTGLTGCGGGSSNPPTQTAPTGTAYTFTLTGNDSVATSVKASTTFTLTVQ